MTSTLPSRWQEILRREAAGRVGAVLAQAREQPEATRQPRWLVPAVVVVLSSVSLFSLIGGSEAKGPGSVPFDRSTLISTRSAGLGASAEDLAPRVPVTAAAPALELAPTVAPTPTAAASSRRARPRRDPVIRASQPALEAVAPLIVPPEPTATPTPAAVTVNVG